MPERLALPMHTAKAPFTAPNMHSITGSPRCACICLAYTTILMMKQAAKLPLEVHCNVEHLLDS